MTVQKLAAAITAAHPSHTTPVVNCAHCKRAAADVARMLGC